LSQGSSSVGLHPARLVRELTHRLAYTSVRPANNARNNASFSSAADDASADGRRGTLCTTCWSPSPLGAYSSGIGRGTRKPSAGADGRSARTTLRSRSGPHRAASATRPDHPSPTTRPRLRLNDRRSLGRTAGEHSTGGEEHHQSRTLTHAIANDVRLQTGERSYVVHEPSPRRKPEGRRALRCARKWPGLYKWCDRGRTETVSPNPIAIRHTAVATGRLVRP
jgi:hypothetical protein